MQLVNRPLNAAAAPVSGHSSSLRLVVKVLKNSYQCSSAHRSRHYLAKIACIQGYTASPPADDQPDAHNPNKGVDHSRRSSLDEAVAPSTNAIEDEVVSSSVQPGHAELELAAEETTAAVQAAAAEAEAKALAKAAERAAAQQQEEKDDEEEQDSADDDNDDQPANLDELVNLLEQRLAIKEDGKQALLKQLKREPVLPSLDLQGVAELIKSGRAKRIITMTGAGISVSAGIPDFRTPGTGLYSQLERFGLPEPEAVFSINFFKKNPKPFHLLAKELFPGNYQPTPTHFFIKLLHDKGLLLRAFTQNIDSLEHEAGLPQSAVVAAHGNFDSAHCIKCHKEHTLEHVKAAVFADDICYCTKCGGLVKPDIVFFGEQLPDRFYERLEYDFPTCDLLLVMGTSLVVHPFASLIDAVPEHCPRVLINRERVGEGMGGMGLMASLLGLGSRGGFTFEADDGAYRDVLYLGDTDDGVRELCDLLGWRQDLEDLIAAAPAAAGSPSKAAPADAADISSERT